MNYRQITERLLDWFGSNARDLPWRRTTDPYAIWVSEVMLQQTQVTAVVPYWKRWMRALPTIAALARAQPAKIHKLWEGLGYYTRVRNLQKAARLIVERHGGRFPRDYEDVLALPGVGRYTAGAICSIAFDRPTPILDGNVIRVLTRLFGIEGNPREGKTNAQLWKLAEQLVLQAARIPAPMGAAVGAKRSHKGVHAPLLRGRRRTSTAGNCSHLNQSLMELGALVCTPRDPRCRECPLARLCVARRQGRVDELPNLDRRQRTTERQFAAFIVTKANRYLVRQRPAGVVNAYLWEFPNIEVTGDGARPEDAYRKLFGRSARRLQPFCTIKHSITKYRITMDVFLTGAPQTNSSAASRDRWLSLPALRRLAFTSAHRKVLDRLRAGGAHRGRQKFNAAL